MVDSPGISEAPTRKPKPRTAEQRAEMYQPVPTLTILCHPNPKRMGERAVLFPLLQKQPALLSRREPAFSHPDSTSGHPLHDPYISRAPIFIQPSSGNDFVLDQGQSGTEVSINGEPLRGRHLVQWVNLERGVRLQLSGRILLLFHLSRYHSQHREDTLGLVGFSDVVMALREEIYRVRDLDTPLLLRGASGTGKELVARAIHCMGGKSRPLVSVNMSAIPPTLAASELFGANKGAYTGSDRAQTGFFRAAHGGTLFLDEIGETPADVQPMLLRALESGEVQSVGSQSSQKVQVRLIAATDADLESKMEEQSFRTPLFHRLSGYVIQLPSLAQRRDDLGRLFLHFAQEFLAEMNELHHLNDPGPDADPWMPPALMDALVRFSWPGNIRQLRNVVRQLVIASRERPQLLFTAAIRKMLDAEQDTKKVPPFRPRKPKDIDGESLFHELQQNDWDIKATAEALGISRGSVYTLIEKTPGLCKASDLGLSAIQTALNENSQDVVATAQALRVSLRALRRRMFELKLTE